MKKVRLVLIVVFVLAVGSSAVFAGYDKKAGALEEGKLDAAAATETAAQTLEETAEAANEGAAEELASAEAIDCSAISTDCEEGNAECLQAAIDECEAAAKIAALTEGALEGEAAENLDDEAELAQTESKDALKAVALEETATPEAAK